MRWSSRGASGENAPRLRADCLAGLGRLGIEVNPSLNTTDADGPRLISAHGSVVTVLVVPTNEELAIARQVAALVG
jgi:acetate kinase